MASRAGFGGSSPALAVPAVRVATGVRGEQRYDRMVKPRVPCMQSVSPCGGLLLALLSPAGCDGSSLALAKAAGSVARSDHR